MSKKHKVQKKSETDDEDISIDFSSVVSFFSKLKNINLLKSSWLPIVLILIAVFFSVFFRAFPADLAVTENWAETSVRNSVSAQISSQIDGQYPNLPTASRQTIINEQVSEFMANNKDQISGQISSLADQFRSRLQNDEGQTYLLAIDPYFYYRYAVNLDETGKYEDDIIDGEPWDTHMEAPLGRPIKYELHSYTIIGVHKLLSLFGNRSVLASAFIIPILLSALAVIPAFFIARKRGGNLGGFIAAMIVAVHSAFLGRTAGGFSDTDAYSVLFPLIITWLFMESFETSNLKKRLGFLLASGVTVGLYSFAWSGWWYIFDFLVGVTIAYMIFILVKKFVNTKSISKSFDKIFWSNGLFLVLFIGVSALFVSIAHSINTFWQAATGPFVFTVIKQAALPNLWPNVYTTVAELNPASLGGIVAQIGGTFIFFLASMGVLFTLVGKKEFTTKDYIFICAGAIFYFVLISNMTSMQPMNFLILFLIPVLAGTILLLKDKRGIDMKYSIFLIVWFIGTIYASTKGARFILLIVPVFGIAAGIFSGVIHRILTKLANKSLNINKTFASIVIIIFVLLILINPIRVAEQTAKNEIPSMNDAWWNSLTAIKENSESNAIITSWWDFGHWFKAVADRPVTFDGASQNSPKAHWVGNALMSSDEETTVEILKMLDCGGNSAITELNKNTQDTEKSYRILRTVMDMSKSDAEQYLFDNDFSQEEITTILPLFNCEPPEAFFITSGDMVGKAGVWGHFGAWNFSKAWIANNAKDEPLDVAIDMIIERYGISETEASNTYFEMQGLNTDQAINAWISPWPSYAGTGSGCREEFFNDTKENGIICNFNFAIGNQNGQNLVLQSGVIFPDSLNDSYAEFVAVDSNTGAITGASRTTFVKVAYASNNSDVISYEFDESGLAFELFISEQPDGSYRAVLADPLLAESTFTKLFYFDGAHANRFEKFSDQTTVFGSRIIIWKVNWDGV